MTQEEIKESVIQRFHENLICTDISEEIRQFIEELAAWSVDYTYTLSIKNKTETNI